jgi:hypothetical protein
MTYTQEIPREVKLSEQTDRQATVIRNLCLELFPDARHAFRFSRVAYWADSYPLETILYGVLEAKFKKMRTEALMQGMEPEHIATFAENVMLRRSRHPSERKNQ